MARRFGFWIIGTFCLVSATLAFAIYVTPPPQPVEYAPIDRALANVAANADFAPAERARIQGRLNLLAYLRNTDTVPYLVGGDLVEEGTVRCVDVPTRSPRTADDSHQPFGPEDRCADRTFDIGPKREIPDKGHLAGPVNESARARLEAAKSITQRPSSLTQKTFAGASATRTPSINSESVPPPSDSCAPLSALACPSWPAPGRTGRNTPFSPKR